MSTKIKIENYISLWESRCYSNGIPDEAPARLEALGKVPSYKSIVRAILKNDLHLKSLGFSAKKTKLYSSIKKEEIALRNNCIQLKLDI